MLVKGGETSQMEYARDVVINDLKGNYRGIVGVQGTLQGNREVINQLINEPLISIADVHGYFAKKSFQEDHPSLNERIDLHVNPLHWILGL